MSDLGGDEPALPRWVKRPPYPDLRHDGVMLTGKPDKRLVKEFVRHGKRRLYINYARGSEVADLEFLADIGPYVEGLDVVHGGIDDSGVRHCGNLQDLSLNTRRSGVLDWQPFSRLRRLFAYGDRFGKSGFGSLRLHDLYLYAPKMRNLRPLEEQPLRHLSLAPARSLRSLHGLETQSLTSLMLAYTRSDLDLTALASQPEVEHINLDHVLVKSLDWIAEMPRLRSLTLGDTGPLPTLAPLRDHPGLETLHIYGKNRPPAAEADLIIALPNLQTAVVVGMELPARLSRG